MSWLYDKLSDDIWSEWIPNTSRSDFKKGGYWSSMVRHNLCVIALNTNICQRNNYWIAYSSVDPDGQLKWLVEQLTDAESRGVHVIIVGHVPPSDCYPVWFSNYLSIVQRYEAVIVGQYFGHTHKEEILVYYTADNSTSDVYPISHAYIAGSITTHSGLNPSYRIYQLDGSVGINQSSRKGETKILLTMGKNSWSKNTP